MNREDLRVKLSLHYDLLPDVHDSNGYADALAPALHLLPSLHDAYQFEREVHVFIWKRDVVNARAVHVDGAYALLICSGVIDFAQGQLEIFYPEGEEISVGESLLNRRMLLQIYIAYVLFHEYTHAARGHLDYLTANHLSLVEADFKALEFDADAFASAMTYRLVQHVLKGFSDDVIISLVLTSIYWPLRVLAGLEVRAWLSSTHPSPAARLGVIHGKLISMDNIVPPGIPSDPVLTRQRVELTATVLMDLEDRFYRSHNVQRDSSFLYNLFDSKGSWLSEVLECSAHWPTIEQKVLACEVNSDEKQRMDWRFEDGRFCAGWYGSMDA